MAIEFQLPSPALAHFVECYWYWSGSSSPTRERVLPTGAGQLICDLSNPGQAVLCGPRSKPVEIEMGGEERSLIGVFFKPGGVARFFGLPASEVHNGEAPLTEVSRESNVWQEQVVEAAFSDRPSRAFLKLNHALESQTRTVSGRRPEVGFALGEIMRQDGPSLRPLAEMARQVGLSQRQFIQVFRDEVGMAPKRFARVRRFHKAIHRLGKKERLVDWADLVYECGYYDQAHLIRDFHEFAGLTPTAYLERRCDYPTHVNLES